MYCTYIRTEYRPLTTAVQGTTGWYDMSLCTGMVLHNVRYVLHTYPLYKVQGYMSTHCFNLIGYLERRMTTGPKSTYTQLEPSWCGAGGEGRWRLEGYIQGKGGVIMV